VPPRDPKRWHITGILSRSGRAKSSKYLDDERVHEIVLEHNPNDASVVLAPSKALTDVLTCLVTEFVMAQVHTSQSVAYLRICTTGC
jgi:hypothetical protein